MKRIISFLLAILLVTPFVTFYVPSADALGAVWVKEFYTDKFGDKTEQFYLTNKSQFKGTYNSDSVSKGKLGAKLIFERDGESLRAYIDLFLKGKDQVKNGTSSSFSYDISVKRSSGSQFTTSGKMAAGDDRIEISDTVDFSTSIQSGDIDIYVEDSNNANINYLFRVKSGNFNDLFNQEILTPYREEKYQEAEKMLEEKKYNDAISAFEALAGYKDSSARAEEIAESQNAEAYAKAEKLLEQKQFDKAAKAFESLGDYRDSATRVDEVYEAEKADSYDKAKALLESGKYDAAYKAFAKLAGYKDVDALLKSDNNLVAAATAAREAKLKPYKMVGNIVNFGAYEQDNNTSNGKEDIEWIVLETKGNQSLLISRYELDCQKYHATHSSVTWESCSLRSWLNSTFLNAAFSSEERKAILETTVDNSIKLNNETASGGNNTTDQIFLLSSSEAEKYFRSDEERICTPTAYAKAQGAVSYHKSECGWWLRTPGYELTDSTEVSDYGYVHVCYVSAPNTAVRPAFWINLDADFFKS